MKIVQLPLLLLIDPAKGMVIWLTGIETVWMKIGHSAKEAARSHTNKEKKKKREKES